VIHKTDISCAIRLWVLVTLSEQIIFELSSFYNIFPLKVARNLFSFPDSDKNLQDT